LKTVLEESIKQLNRVSLGLILGLVTSSDLVM